MDILGDPERIGRRDLSEWKPEFAKRRLSHTRENHVIKEVDTGTAT